MHRLAPTIGAQGKRASFETCVLSHLFDVDNHRERKEHNNLNSTKNCLLFFACDFALQGYVPMFVNATAGTTVYGAFDPINEIADICEKYNMWLHVDVREY